MEQEVIAKLRIVRIGIVLSLLTVLFGFVLGGIFGAAESTIKTHLKDSADAVFVEVYDGDAAKMGKVTSKSWTYFKRSHLHACGLGAISLGTILLLAFLPATLLIKKITAVFLGLGSFGYGLFWMIVGLKAPGLGSTGAAKEALSFLAIPSAGMCILGMLSVLLIFLMIAFKTNEKNS
jgi:hypothetical protein